MSRFANYTVRQRLCMYVVYQEDAKRRKHVARFADGHPAIFASARDAFRWVIYRIAHHVGFTVAVSERLS
jgi:hypothetical protein